MDYSFKVLSEHLKLKEGFEENLKSRYPLSTNTFKNHINNTEITKKISAIILT